LSSPSVQVVSNGVPICDGDQVSLAATGAQSYTWSTGGNSPIIAVSPSMTTTYTLTGSGANGCTSSALFTQSVNACTGIALNKKSAVVYSLYPIPASSGITVTGEELKTIEVYNLQGQLLIQFTVSSAVSHIEITALADGFYLLKIEGTHGAVQTQRILVRH
jgi:predicted cation transporter